MKSLLFITTFILLALSVRSQNNNPGPKDLKDIPDPDPNKTYYHDTIYTSSSGPYYNYALAPASFPGGFDKFYDALNKNLQYPITALNKNIGGLVYVSMIIRKDGTITNVKAIRGPSKELIAEAARLVSSSPKWNPAVIENKSVNSEDAVTIMFSPSPHPKVMADTTIYDYSVAQTLPMFINGVTAFYRFIEQNFRYVDNVAGPERVSCVVEMDGSLTDIKVQNGLSPKIDTEAIRVMKLSPKWVPATRFNNPVRVRYVVVISFPLDR